MTQQEPPDSKNERYITLKGINSDEHIGIDLVLIDKLIVSYLIDLPNEKRTVAVSMGAVRLADSLNRMILAESDAAEKKIHDNIMKAAAEQELNNPEGVA